MLASQKMRRISRVSRGAREGSPAPIGVATTIRVVGQGRGRGRLAWSQAGTAGQVTGLGLRRRRV